MKKRKKFKPLSLDEQREWYKKFIPQTDRAKPQTPTDRWNSAGRPAQVTAFVTKVEPGGFTTVQDEFFRTLIFTKHSKRCPQGLKAGTEGLLLTIKYKGMPTEYRFILNKKRKRR